ncbi:MAG: phosphatase PAP2 family protein [Alphaproteobacteria bacterium]|jgi:membrane-associated phospholipid phosphatase|nr:phosphatase PAP2 family protein [Alphaproteobacteria bacterium]
MKNYTHRHAVLRHGIHRVFFLSLLFMLNLGLLHATWDSPDFITSQSSTAVKTQEMLGNIGLVALNLFAITLIAHNEDKAGLREYLYGISTTTALSFGGKYLIKRPRPDGSDNYSMPSAHSAYSFFAATFITKRYGEKYNTPAYAAATFVAYSRVAARKHNISDVIVGGFLGATVASLFTTQYKVNSYTLSVVPTLAKDSFHIQLNLSS